MKAHTVYFHMEKTCDCGVMVATGDLKSPVFGRAGSSPASRTMPL
jgi:hypothetical protein